MKARRRLPLIVSSSYSGKPSILVNIAGGFVWETLADGGPSTWERMFRINALTAVTTCKVLLPTLSEQAGAAIINIGAAAAGKADMGMGAYTASKAAVAKLTESLAAELADKDVTVNAVLPTIIDTATNRADMPDADFSSWVRAKDIAQVIAFLASDGARSITGGEHSRFAWVGWLGHLHCPRACRWRVLWWPSKALSHCHPFRGIRTANS